MTPRPRQAGFTLLQAGFALLGLGFVCYSASLALGTLQLKRAEAQDLSRLRALGSALGRFESEQHHFPRAGWNDPRQRWHGSRASLDLPFDPDGGFLARVGVLPDRRRADLDSRVFEVEYRRHGFPEPLGTGGWGYNPLLDSLPSANVTNRAAVIAFTSAAEPRGRALLETPFTHPPLGVPPEGAPPDPTTHFRYSGQALVLWADGRVTREAPARVPPRNRYLGNNDKWNVGWFGPTNDNGYWNPRNRLPAAR